MHGTLATWQGTANTERTATRASLGMRGSGLVTARSYEGFYISRPRQDEESIETCDWKPATRCAVSCENCAERKPGSRRLVAVAVMSQHHAIVLARAKRDANAPYRKPSSDLRLFRRVSHTSSMHNSCHNVATSLLYSTNTLKLTLGPGRAPV
jgi:hypothetical protein